MQPHTGHGRGSTCPSIPLWGLFSYSFRLGSLAFSQLPWPPGEQGGRADHLWLLLQYHASRQLRLFQFIDVSKALINQRIIAQLPQMLCRLQLR